MSEKSSLSVYFVSSLDMSRVKIGKTKNLLQRHKDLQRQGPEQLLLVADVAGYTCVEAALHNRFGDLRLHGEWFLGDSRLYEVIRDVQRVGRGWSLKHYPEHLKADGVEWTPTQQRGVRGTGSYAARARLFKDGFRVRSMNRQQENA